LTILQFFKKRRKNIHCCTGLSTYFKFWLLSWLHCSSPSNDELVPILPLLSWILHHHKSNSH